MGQALGYDFDKTHIKNAWYSPVAHGQIDEELQAIRRGVVDLMDGKRVLPMYVTNLGASPQPQPRATEERIADRLPPHPEAPRTTPGGRD